MNNALLMVLEYVIATAVVIAYAKFLGKKGMYIAVAVLIIASEVIVAKTFRIGMLELTCGNMSMGFVFTVLTSVTEVFGPKEARKALWAGFLGELAFVLLGMLSVLYAPSPTDFAHGYLQQVFHFTPRIALSSWIAYIIAGYFSTWLMKVLQPHTKLWMRNNASTKLGQILDNFIFVFGAYSFILPLNVIWSIWLTSTIVEFVLDYADTWVAYVLVAILKRKGEQVGV